MPQPEQECEFRPGGRAPLAGTNGRGEFAGNVVPLWQTMFRFVPPHPSDPIMWRPLAPTSERSESLARRMCSLAKDGISVMQDRG
jgi:hypothetical protein